jgi:hypothetical protein
MFAGAEIADRLKPGSDIFIRQVASYGQTGGDRKSGLWRDLIMIVEVACRN